MSMFACNRLEKGVRFRMIARRPNWNSLTEKVTTRREGPQPTLCVCGGGVVGGCVCVFFFFWFVLFFDFCFCFVLFCFVCLFCFFVCLFCFVLFCFFILLLFLIFIFQGEGASKRFFGDAKKLSNSCSSSVTCDLLRYIWDIDDQFLNFNSVLVL